MIWAPGDLSRLAFGPVPAWDAIGEKAAMNTPPRSLRPNPMPILPLSRSAALGSGEIANEGVVAGRIGLSIFSAPRPSSPSCDSTTLQGPDGARLLRNEGESSISLHGQLADHFCQEPLVRSRPISDYRSGLFLTFIFAPVIMLRSSHLQCPPVDRSRTLSGPDIPKIGIGRLRTVLLGQFIHLDQQGDRRCPTEEDGLARRQTGKLFQQPCDIVGDKACDKRLI